MGRNAAVVPGRDGETIVAWPVVNAGGTGCSLKSFGGHSVKGKRNELGIGRRYL